MVSRKRRFDNTEYIPVPCSPADDLDSWKTRTHSAPGADTNTLSVGCEIIADGQLWLPAREAILATQTVSLTGIETHTGKNFNDDFTVTDNVVGSNTLTLGKRHSIKGHPQRRRQQHRWCSATATDQIRQRRPGSSNTLTTGNGNDQVTVTGGSNTRSRSARAVTRSCLAAASREYAEHRRRQQHHIRRGHRPHRRYIHAVTSGNGSINKPAVTTRRDH